MTPADQLLASEASVHWQRVGAHHHHGVAAPLFSLHSQSSLGIGEFPDLIGLIDWVKACGMDTVQLLPLNDTGRDPSPYSALSAFALNPIYLSLAALPGFDESHTLPLTPRVDYKGVWALKLKFLQAYVRQHRLEILANKEFASFLANNSWLEEYALFKALRRHNRGLAWQDWPPESQNPSPALKQELCCEIEFELILQFFCDQQLHAVKTYADSQGVLLMGDIPILVGRNSHSVWKRRDLFNIQLSAGAPPDPYAELGQNWEVPLYNWPAHEADDFSWWKQRLENAARYYHLYRIDHVIGLFRFWAMAPGDQGTEGRYIPDQFEEWFPLGLKLLRMMLKSSPLLPVGEDIGNVPHEIPRALNSLGIPNTRFIPWLYPWGDGQDYHPASLSLLATHDSQSLREWWQVHPDAKSCAAFHQWPYGQPLTTDQHRTLLRESHHTTSFFHINPLQEYLALFPDLRRENPADERINVPGTISNFNWTYRFRPSLEELQAHTQLRSTIANLVNP